MIDLTNKTAALKAIDFDLNLIEANMKKLKEKYNFSKEIKRILDLVFTALETYDMEHDFMAPREIEIKSTDIFDKTYIESSEHFKALEACRPVLGVFGFLMSIDLVNLDLVVTPK